MTNNQLLITTTTTTAATTTTTTNGQNFSRALVKVLYLSRHVLPRVSTVLNLDDERRLGSG